MHWYRTGDVRLRHRASCCALLIVALLLSGCSQQQLNKQITDFDASVSTGANAIAAYYTGLNDQEMKIYLEFLAFNPQFEVGDALVIPELDAGGNPTGQNVTFDSPLKKPAFSDKQIAARIKALKELTDYSKNLAALAGADAPANFQANVTTLKERLIALRDSFRNLQNDQAQPDPRAGKFLDPLTSLIGVVGKWYLNERRWSELRKSIIEAEPYVNTILDGVSEDLDSYVFPLAFTAADERYTQAILYYNKNRRTLSLAERVEALDHIRDYKVAYDAAKANRPSAVAQRMKKAHQALVKAAKQNRSPASLAELRAELEFLKDDINTLVTAVRQITGSEEAAS